MRANAYNRVSKLLKCYLCSSHEEIAICEDCNKILCDGCFDSHDCYNEQDLSEELECQHMQREKAQENPFEHKDKKKLKNYKPKDAETDLSKRLSGILRHRAISAGLPIRSDGYVELAKLLEHHQFNFTNDAEIRWVVFNSDKKRFEINILEDGIEYIRAVQGHSMSFINANELLEEIHDPAEVPICIHGTYQRFEESIIREGLSRRTRNHIHFAVDRPGGEVISGSRLNVDMLIHVDVRRAMEAGHRFYRSVNNVILSEGPISAEYFQVEKL
jgi:2'-phosphotransferase